MPFEYIDIETAKSAEGLKMVVIKGIPSPWGEAAKAILHLKNLPWKAVYHRPADPVLAEWTGHHNAPVLLDENSKPLVEWDEILRFAEDRAPEPRLLPQDAENRAALLELAHEMMGQDGLAWNRRLQVVHLAMQLGGTAQQHAGYVGKKYGYDPQHMESVEQRVQDLLGSFSKRLKDQQAQGSDYYFGNTITALDIYSAAVMALFAPLPEAQCAMDPATRAGFSYLDAPTKAALDPVLLAHRDRIYEQHLELPLSL